MVVNKKTLMTAQDVIGLLKLFEQNGIVIIVDGGWGVDALLGKQTRLHNDLDIALSHTDVPKAREILVPRGFKDVPRDDTSEYDFVLGDDLGHQIDFHSFLFDETGKHIFGIPYPLDSFAGTGEIEGYKVRCITPEWMVKFHTGYTLDENDYHDVSALCEKFSIPLPEEYKKFVD